MQALLVDKAKNPVGYQQLQGGQMQHPAVIVKGGKAYIFSHEQGIQELVYVESDTLFLDAAVEVAPETITHPVQPEIPSDLPKQEAPKPSVAEAAAKIVADANVLAASMTAEELKQEKLADEAHDAQAN